MFSQKWYYAGKWKKKLKNVRKTFLTQMVCTYSMTQLSHFLKICVFYVVIVSSLAKLANPNVNKGDRNDGDLPRPLRRRLNGDFEMDTSWNENARITFYLLKQ